MKAQTTKRLAFIDIIIGGEIKREWIKSTEADTRELFQKFRLKHFGEKLWIQMGVETETDYDRHWLNYWWGFVVNPIASKFAGGDEDYASEILSVFFPNAYNMEELIALYGVFGFAKKEYIHACLKKVFFKDRFCPETGLPVKKSFGSHGNIGATEIRERLPYIQRWASEKLNLNIRDFGEVPDIFSAGKEMTHIDISHDPEYRHNKAQEAESWASEGYGKK